MYLTPHLEVLSEAQRWVYPQLRNLKNHGFVLYGGSALALQFGQRQSTSFEFFLNSRLNQKLLRDAFPLLDDESVVSQIQDSENTLTFEITHPVRGKGTVTISFFGNIAYGRVGEPQLTEDGVLLVASTLDIFAAKLKAIIEKPSTQDYIDIVRLIKNDESLLEALGAASVLFGTDFSPMISLKALSYFDELKPPLSQFDASFLVGQVSNALNVLNIKGLEKPSLTSENLSFKETKNF